MSGQIQPVASWPGVLEGIAPATPIVVVGGTFDPPHLAHVALPRFVRDRVLPGAALLFVPAATSPFKRGATSTPASHRVAMLELAIRGVPNAGVWTDEIDRADGSSPSYTIDTLRRLHDLRPGAPLVLLVGADQAVLFHKWKDCREILAIARVLIVLREPFTTPEALLDEVRKIAFWADIELERWGAAVVDAPLDRVSATSIREDLRSKGVGAAANRIDPAVREYIEQQHLYA